MALASSTNSGLIQPPSVLLKLHRSQPGVDLARSHSSAAKLPPPAGVLQNRHPAVGGSEHGQQAGLPHRLQVGDVGEFVHQQQVGLLATKAVGEVGAGQGDLAAVAEFHGEGGFHGPVDPAGGHHLLQVGPSDVLGHLSAGGQIKDLAAGLFQCRGQCLGEHQPGFAEPAAAEQHADPGLRSVDSGSSWL